MNDKYFYINSLSPLYEDIQASGIFPDSKYFVDSTPKESINNILNRYSEQKNVPSFSLESFVRQYFHLP